MEKDQNKTRKTRMGKLCKEIGFQLLPEKNREIERTSSGKSIQVQSTEVHKNYFSSPV